MSKIAQMKDDQGRWVIARRALPRPVVSLAAVVEQEQRKSSRARAVAIVPIPKLIKKLGRTTYRLWCVLLTVRDEHSQAHPTNPGLSRMSGIGEAQVAKSLRRLRSFKLVEDYGKMYRHVPCNCSPDQGYHDHEVYVRDVFGEVRARPEYQRHDALVPRETAKLVEEAAGHGGARKGAGRPKGAKDLAPRKPPRKSKVRAYKYQVPVCIQNLKVLHTNAEFHSAPCFTSQEVQEREMGTTQRGGCEGASCEEVTLGSLPNHSQPCSPSPTPALLVKPSGASGPAKGASATPPAQPIGRAAPAAPALSTAASAARAALASPPALAGEAPILRVAGGLEDDGLEFLWDGEEHDEVELRGGASRPQRFTPEDVLAATRVLDVIETLQVPAPPKIDPASSPDEQLRLLGLAYRAAHERVLHSDYYRPRGRQETPKEREALLAAAVALAAENISPAAWAKFSFQQWGRIKNGAPSVKWVWSCKRITEHARWCHDEIGSLARQKTVPVNSNTELMRRLGQLQSQLGKGRPTQEVVGSVIPEQERLELAARARQERAEALRKINQQIAQGEWVWG